MLQVTGLIVSLCYSLSLVASLPAPIPPTPQTPPSLPQQLPVSHDCLLALLARGSAPEVGGEGRGEGGEGGGGRGRRERGVAGGGGGRIGRGDGRGEVHGDGEGDGPGHQGRGGHRDGDGNGDGHGHGRGEGKGPGYRSGDAFPGVHDVVDGLILVQYAPPAVFAIACSSDFERSCACSEEAVNVVADHTFGSAPPPALTPTLQLQSTRGSLDVSAPAGVIIGPPLALALFCRRHCVATETLRTARLEHGAVMSMASLPPEPFADPAVHRPFLTSPDPTPQELTPSPPTHSRPRSSTMPVHQIERPIDEHASPSDQDASFAAPALPPFVVASAAIVCGPAIAGPRRRVSCVVTLISPALPPATAATLVDALPTPALLRRPLSASAHSHERLPHRRSNASASTAAALLTLLSAVRGSPGSLAPASVLVPVCEPRFVPPGRANSPDGAQNVPSPPPHSPASSPTSGVFGIARGVQAVVTSLLAIRIHSTDRCVRENGCVCDVSGERCRCPRHQRSMSSPSEIDGLPFVAASTARSQLTTKARPSHQPRAGKIGPSATPDACEHWSAVALDISLDVAFADTRVPLEEPSRRATSARGKESPSSHDLALEFDAVECAHVGLVIVPGTALSPGLNASSMDPISESGVLSPWYVPPAITRQQRVLMYQRAILAAIRSAEAHHATLAACATVDATLPVPVRSPLFTTPTPTPAPSPGPSPDLYGSSGEVSHVNPCAAPHAWAACQPAQGAGMESNWSESSWNGTSLQSLCRLEISAKGSFRLSAGLLTEPSTSSNDLYASRLSRYGGSLRPLPAPVLPGCGKWWEGAAENVRIPEVPFAIHEPVVRGPSWLPNLSVPPPVEVCSRIAWSSPPMALLPRPLFPVDDTADSDFVSSVTPSPLAPLPASRTASNQRPVLLAGSAVALIAVSPASSDEWSFLRVELVGQRGGCSEQLMQVSEIELWCGMTRIGVGRRGGQGGHGEDGQGGLGAAVWDVTVADDLRRPMVDGDAASRETPFPSFLKRALTHFHNISRLAAGPSSNPLPHVSQAFELSASKSATHGLSGPSVTVEAFTSSTLLTSSPSRARSLTQSTRHELSAPLETLAPFLDPVDFAQPITPCSATWRRRHGSGLGQWLASAEVADGLTLDGVGALVAATGLHRSMQGAAISHHLRGWTSEASHVEDFVGDDAFSMTESDIEELRRDVPIDDEGPDNITIGAGVGDPEGAERAFDGERTTKWLVDFSSSLVTRARQKDSPSPAEPDGGGRCCQGEPQEVSARRRRVPPATSAAILESLGAAAAWIAGNATCHGGRAVVLLRLRRPGCVTHIRIVSANDAPNRDPIFIRLSGFPKPVSPLDRDSPRSPRAWSEILSATLSQPSADTSVCATSSPLLQQRNAISPPLVSAAPRSRPLSLSSPTLVISCVQALNVTPPDVLRPTFADFEFANQNLDTPTRPAPLPPWISWAEPGAVAPNCNVTGPQATWTSIPATGPTVLARLFGGPATRIAVGLLVDSSSVNTPITGTAYNWPVPVADCSRVHPINLSAVRFGALSSVWDQCTAAGGSGTFCCPEPLPVLSNAPTAHTLPPSIQSMIFPFRLRPRGAPARLPAQVDVSRSPILRFLRVLAGAAAVHWGSAFSVCRGNISAPLGGKVPRGSRLCPPVGIVPSSWISAFPLVPSIVPVPGSFVARVPLTTLRPGRQAFWLWIPPSASRNAANCTLCDLAASAVDAAFSLDADVVESRCRPLTESPGSSPGILASCAAAFGLVRVESASARPPAAPCMSESAARLALGSGADSRGIRGLSRGLHWSSGIWGPEVAYTAESAVTVLPREQNTPRQETDQAWKYVKIL